MYICALKGITDAGSEGAQVRIAHYGYIVFAWSLLGASGVSQTAQVESPSPAVAGQPSNPSPSVTEGCKRSLFGSGSPNNMDTTVARTDMGEQVHLVISFKAPKASSVVRAPFDLIKVYGSQKVGSVGGRKLTANLPASTYPYFHGKWNPGDCVTISVDVPKQYSDPVQGWTLTFCIGSTNACVPSPNLLEGKRTH